MILHIVDRDEWNKAKEKGVYVNDSLKTEGFIHCSPVEKVVPVANFNFKGIENLVLLCIDEKKVKAKVKFEDLYEIGYDYPHIYGELNCDAVIDAIDFPVNEDGSFSLPSIFKKL